MTEIIETKKSKNTKRYEINLTDDKFSNESFSTQSQLVQRAKIWSNVRKLEKK